MPATVQMSGHVSERVTLQDKTPFGPIYEASSCWPHELSADNVNSLYCWRSSREVEMFSAVIICAVNMIP